MIEYDVLYRFGDNDAPPESSAELAFWLGRGWHGMSWSIFEGNHDDAARAIFASPIVRDALDRSEPHMWPRYLWIRSEAHGLTRHELAPEYMVKRWVEPAASAGVAVALPEVADVVGR